MNLENSAKIKTAKTKREIKRGQNVVPKYYLHPATQIQGKKKMRAQIIFKETWGNGHKPGEGAVKWG